MKRIILLLLGMLLALPQFAQERKYSTYYYQRATLFEELPITSEDIVFVGNSITDGCEWRELFDNVHVKNRGISGDICMGVYDRLDPILKGQPAKIFLLIGTNNISRGMAADTIVSEIAMIIQKIKRESPKTKLYLQSVLPVNDCYGMFGGHTSRWQVVKQVNDLLQPLTEKEGIAYIDLYSHFVEGDTGKMNPQYTNDGLHLLGKGYLLWRDIVKPYVDEK